VPGFQNVKPEDGKAAVTAESLSRLASVGLQYGFFIGCLGPVDDQNRTATYARRPLRQALRKIGRRGKFDRRENWPPETGRRADERASRWIRKPMLRLEI